jgi:acyl-coenzyme A thioesterase PaaI-like protein
LTSEAPAAGVVAGPGVAPFDLVPHNCFACGTLNRHGLRLLLHVEPRRSWTELALDQRFEGWAGMAHGGIVCTILDEVMAWALVGEDNWGVTARLSVDFQRPVPIGARIRADGEIASSRRRIVETTARIVAVEDGSVLATAKGTYLAADSTRRRELRERYGFRFVDDVEVDTPAKGDGPARTVAAARRGVRG